MGARRRHARPHRSGRRARRPRAIRSGSTGSFMASGPRDCFGRLTSLVRPSRPGLCVRIRARNLSARIAPREFAPVASDPVGRVARPRGRRPASYSSRERSCSHSRSTSSGGTGMVECDHLPQRRPELLASPGILVVEGRGVDAPEPGDLPDRHPFVESEPEQLDAPQGRLAVLGGPGPTAARPPRARPPWPRRGRRPARASPHGPGCRRDRRPPSARGRAVAPASPRPAARRCARPRRGTRGTPRVDRPAPDRAGRRPGGTRRRRPGRRRRVPGAASSPATGPPGRPGPPACTGRRIRHERPRPPRRRPGAGSSRWNLDPPCSPHVDVAPEQVPSRAFREPLQRVLVAVHQGERHGPAVDLRGVAGQEHLQGGPRVVHARPGLRVGLDGMDQVGHDQLVGRGPSRRRSRVRASPGRRW